MRYKLEALVWLAWETDRPRPVAALPLGMDSLGPRQGKDEGLRDAQAAAAHQGNKGKDAHGFLFLSVLCMSCVVVNSAGGVEYG